MLPGLEWTLTPTWQPTTLTAISTAGRDRLLRGGWQIHAERISPPISLGARGDTEARWDDLVPAYQELAASIS